MVEEWGHEWEGFKFSVEKTKTILFTRKRIVPEREIKMYERSLEKVRVFKFLDVYFDITLTWNEHINRTVQKCQKVLKL